MTKKIKDFNEGRKFPLLVHPMQIQLIRSEKAGVEKASRDFDAGWQQETGEGASQTGYHHRLDDSLSGFGVYISEGIRDRTSPISSCDFLDGDRGKGGVTAFERREIVIGAYYLMPRELSHTPFPRFLSI